MSAQLNNLNHNIDIEISELENYLKNHVVNSNKNSSKPLLFGLQLQTLNKVRKSCDKYMIKPAEQSSPKTLKRCATELEIMIKENFIKSTKSKYHDQNFIELKLFEYAVNNQNYLINFKKDDH
ncbi:12085_t:CDS:2, partial [Cetraspora pellucida]